MRRWMRIVAPCVGESACGARDAWAWHIASASRPACVPCVPLPLPRQNTTGPLSDSLSIANSSRAVRYTESWMKESCHRYTSACVCDCELRDALCAPLHVGEMSCFGTVTQALNPPG
jgi:hypothetical protein